MNPKPLNQFVWIISGLGLILLVWGGLGGIVVLSSASAGLVAVDSPLVPRLGQSFSHLDATLTLIPESRTYVVEPGDNLWTIASKVYGNGARYPLIQQANNLTDSTLRTGQVLVIPPLEADRVSTPRPQAPVSPTPSPSTIVPAPTSAAVPTLALPAPALPTLVPTSLPPATSLPVNTPVPAASASEFGSPVPLVGLVVNVLGTMCLLGSIMCAFLSYDIYRRSRHIARRRYIGNRVRAGL